MIDLTEILITLITLGFGLISAKLIPYLQAKAAKEQAENALFWASVAVEAAEMIYKGVGRGEEKKAYVENFLAQRGFKLDMGEINSLIESSTLNLKIAVEEASKCDPT